MNALIVTDVQNDFTPAMDGKRAGALAVNGGNDIVPLINELMPRFDRVIATQDWHPADHKSFASQHPDRNVFETIEWKGLEQILWPDHCVQSTTGAEFVPGLDTFRFDNVFRKGTDPDIDSYSGFYDNGHRKATGLADELRERGVTDVYVVGIATDVCVKFTVLDACQLGFNTYLIEDACRGVDMSPGDIDRAIEEMKQAGAKVITSAQIPQQA